MATALVHQSLNLEFPARPEGVTEARHSIENFARSLGTADVDAVALAVDEAIANAVLHAYRVRAPGTIALRAEVLVPDTLLVVVSDDGEGMSPHAGYSGLGLGLSLIGSLTTGVEIEPHKPRGTSVRMQFSLTG
jgi:anti-sigma regulatory factor (Ser/Thr protein kinase)